MSLSDKEMIALYNGGLNIRQIAKIARLGRETVRVILKRHGTRMRFRGIKYDPLSIYSHERKLLLAELFGYLIGDGFISETTDGRYDCVLSFALKEKNFVDEVRNIVKQLFGYVPKVVVDHSWYRIVLRRSIARYLYKQCGYPIGKKSIVNPYIPDWIMQARPSVKTAFIRGFLNAEASVDNCVKVPQSVRIFLPRDVQNRLRQRSNIHGVASFKYYSLRWKEAKSIVKEEYVRPSHILLDLQKMLSEFQIDSKICFNRVWMSSRSNSISIHYELYVSKKMLERLKQFNMLKKKDETEMCGGSQARSTAQDMVAL